jgi:hypothetical protein
MQEQTNLKTRIAVLQDGQLNVEPLELLTTLPKTTMEMIAFAERIFLVKMPMETTKAMQTLATGKTITILAINQKKKRLDYQPFSFRVL